MLVLVKTELLKLKRSYMLLMCIAGSICAPLINLFLFLSREHRNGTTSDFFDYMSKTNMFITILIGTLLYGLFTTYIFEREFNEDMYKHLFTIPVNNLKLLISKIITIMISLLLFTLTSFVFATTFGFLSGFSNINLSTIIDSIVIFLRTYITFIPLMMPVILVTFLFKNFIAPMVFSIVAEITFFIIMPSKYISLNPWSAPMLLGTNVMNKDTIPMIGTIYHNLFLLIAVGITSFIACLVYLNRKEIV